MDVQKFIQLGLAKGADEVEVYVEQVKKTQIKIYKSAVESLLSSIDQGVAVRVFVAGRMGFSYSTNVSEVGLEEVLNEAIECASLITKQDGQTLPEVTGNYPDILIYDEELAKTDIQEKINLGLAIEKAAYSYDPRITNIPSITYGDQEGEVRLVNSKGLDQKYKSTFAYAICYVIASENGNTQTGMGVGYGKKIQDMDPILIGERAAKEAIQQLGGKPVESKRVPILFNSHTGSSLFAAFAPGFLAETIQKNKSLFKGKLNTPVASPLVTLIDDGLHKDGLRSAPFDAEGVPMQKTVLIENGILKSYLYDSHTAKKDKVGSTGNAYRKSLKDFVEIAPTNLYLAEGESSFEDLIVGIDEGFLVMSLSGVHSGTNSISGDFSLGASGVWIKDGKLAHPVKEVTIAGNFMNLLKDIEKIGDDLEFDATTGFMGTPSFIVRELSVSGK